MSRRPGWRALGHGGFALGLALAGLVAAVALVSLLWTPYSIQTS